MKKSLAITLQVTIFALVAVGGIIYILNKSPVEDMPEYEKQEMAKPNRGTSVIDSFFAPDKTRNKGFSAEDDDVSLMGKSGRYEEVRIGKSAEE